MVSSKDAHTPQRQWLCKQDTTHELVGLPLGEAYTVNIDNSTSWFASNAFSMAFTDQSVLKQVSLNSDPQLDETIAATASFCVKSIEEWKAIQDCPKPAVP